MKTKYFFVAAFAAIAIFSCKKPENTPTPTVIVSTLAGNGMQGNVDGAGATAQFNYPHGVAVDASGNVYVGDDLSNRIRKITTTGVVSTFAGNGYAEQFSSPSGIAVDATGNLYVADFGNNRIRKITPAGVVSTLAGSGTAGFADGAGTTAQFHRPIDVAVDASGNVYVADWRNHSIRKITPAGVVSTLAGSGEFGFADGEGSAALFHAPSGVAVDASDNVYVADLNNHLIRKITSTGVVSTLAGNWGNIGFADGEGETVQFCGPFGVALDASGNVYVADNGNNRIRKITPAGVVSTLAGSGTAGLADGVGADAQFHYPNGVAVDTSGNVYVADTSNCLIRKITPTGVVSTLAGGGTGISANGDGATATFSGPIDVAVDSSGNVYVVELNAHHIRKIVQE